MNEYHNNGEHNYSCSIKVDDKWVEYRLHNAHVRTYKRVANRLARAEGYGAATVIVRGPENKVVDHTDYGYRKYTTGEYVPNSYINNFGWKNTYYQNAITEVMIKY